MPKASINFFTLHPEDENVAVFHGLEIQKFDPERKDNNVKEKDFILVSQSHSYVMVIEAKKALGRGDSIQKSLHQLLETKEDLKTYFKYNILEEKSTICSEWVFVPMIYCESIEEGNNICDSCAKFIIKGK